MPEIKRGDAVVVLPHSKLKEAAKATVIRLSNEPGRQVGVEFAFASPLFHDCLGTGPAGRCLFVHPQHLRTVEQHEAYLAAVAARPKDPVFTEVETITIGGAASKGGA